MLGLDPSMYYVCSGWGLGKSDVNQADEQVGGGKSGCGGEEEARGDGEQSRRGRKRGTGVDSPGT